MQHFKTERNKQIRADYAEGLGYSDIGRKHEVSRQRIHQIINNYKSLSHRMANAGKQMQLLLKAQKDYLITRSKGRCEEKDCNNTKSLEVHHLDRDTNNNNLDNLKLLCRICHSNQHRTRRVSHGKYQRLAA